MAKKPRNIADLPSILLALAEEEQAWFRRIYHVEVALARLHVPEAMASWIEEHFGSVETVASQQTVKVTNLITLEGALYNSLRGLRPTEALQEVDLRAAIAASEGDAFCHPYDATPEDVFGRVRGRYCVTASNVAKADGFHGVVVFDQHDPLSFSLDRVKDYLHTALSWARKAHCEDKAARYFFFLWNGLWRSGASIVHGHAQMTLGRGMHYAKVEHLRRAAFLYRVAHGTNYFDDLHGVHEALGLGGSLGNVRWLVHLTPVREREVLLLAERPDDALAEATYLVLRAFRDDLGVKSFNVALQMRPIDSTPQDWSGFPAVMRLVDRGDPSHRTSDFGGMELYGTGVIASNPFATAGALLQALSEEG